MPLQIKFYSTYDDLIYRLYSRDILAWVSAIRQKSLRRKIIPFNLQQLNLLNTKPVFQSFEISGARRCRHTQALRKASPAEIIQQVYLGAGNCAYGPIPGDFWATIAS